MTIFRSCAPLLKGGRADEFYESAKVGYILNCTTYRGALFKGSRLVGAIATTCLRVTLFLRLTPFNSPFVKRGDKIWFYFIYIPLSFPLLQGGQGCGGCLGGIKVISCRLCHRSRTDICAHSSHFGTHSGCPLCYEMPRSSLYQKGDRVWRKPLLQGDIFGFGFIYIPLSLAMLAVPPFARGTK